MQRIRTKDDKLSAWVKQLVERRGKNKAAVALAHRLERLVWILLHRNENYHSVANYQALNTGNTLLRTQSKSTINDVKAGFPYLAIVCTRQGFLKPSGSLRQLSADLIRTREYADRAFLRIGRNAVSG